MHMLTRVTQAEVRRALVVDDDPLVAALVCDLLTAAGFEVRVAHGAREATTVLLDFDPDIAILDVALGSGPTGIDLAHIAHRAYPTMALLILTRYPDLSTAHLTAADLPPGCGFLTKHLVSESAVLLGAVESVLAGSHQRMSESGRGTGPLASLTRTQVAVLRMVVQGFTNAEIARRRGCTTNAVEKILTAIYERLEIDAEGCVHPRVEAIRIWANASAIPERLDG